MTAKYHLYFDDTGSRDPDHRPHGPGTRDDGMDCFGLGGILVKEEDVDQIFQAHKAFCAEWTIDYPLHSSHIRGGRGKFSRLRRPENAGYFFPSLQTFLLSLPIIGIACLIDRSGYLARYRDYDDRLWYMCKSAFCILAERAAKFADRHDRKLEIFFERSGKREDRDIIRYLRELKREGNPFNPATSSVYAPFTADDYRRIILGEPLGRTKKMPLLQIADLILYPMAKGGYDPQYPPYRMLKDNDKLIDCLLPEDEIRSDGIKYSCFDHNQ